MDLGFRAAADGPAAGDRAVAYAPAVPDGPPTPLSPADAAGWFDLCRTGAVEVLGVLEGQPLVVVNLDGPGDGGALAVPPLLAAVTVGISAQITDPVPGLDVLLTEEVDPPAPWVHAHTEAAVAQLATAVGASPDASVTLVHVLRAGRPDDLAHDLMIESLAYSTLQAGPEFGAWRKSRVTKPPRPEGGPALLVDRQGTELVITLNRPAVRNAYNRAMRDALCATLAMAVADQTVYTIRWEAAGPDFCSGGDLDEFGSAPDPATAHLVRTARSAARLVAVAADRMTVRLHGSCVGAGIELPALAGRVVADPGTRILLPEVAMGLIPGAGGTASLPRRIGSARTAWLALSGQPLDAATALRWGLVDELSGPSPR
jgi:enoyl-CoA hydratase/carnithine racemase